MKTAKRWRTDSGRPYLAHRFRAARAPGPCTDPCLHLPGTLLEELLGANPRAPYGLSAVRSPSAAMNNTATAEDEPRSLAAEERKKEGHITPERHDSGAVDTTRLTQETSGAPKDAAEAIARNKATFGQNALLPAIDTSNAAQLAHPPLTVRTPHHQSPASAGLHIQTNILPLAVGVYGIR